MYETEVGMAVGFPVGTLPELLNSGDDGALDLPKPPAPSLLPRGPSADGDGGNITEGDNGRVCEGEEGAINVDGAGAVGPEGLTTGEEGLGNNDREGEIYEGLKVPEIGTLQLSPQPSDDLSGRLV